MSTTCTVYDIRTIASRVPARSAHASAAPATIVSISDSPSFSGISEDEAASNRDGLGCARGFRSALFLEFMAGLTVYGIWQLWHLAH